MLKLYRYIVVTKEQRKTNVIASVRQRVDEETFAKIKQSGVFESYMFLMSSSDYAHIRNIILIYNKLNHADLR